MFEDDYIDPKLDLTFRVFLGGLLEELTPTYFITIALFHPRCRMSPRQAYRLYSGDLKDLYKELINRFDRAIYGSRHHKLDEDEEKFRYFYRLETVSKTNDPVFPHVHILIEWDGYDMDRFKENYEKLVASLKQVCRQKGFCPDIDMQPHDGNKRDYIAKYPMVDLLNIGQRGLNRIARRKQLIDDTTVPRNL